MLLTDIYNKIKFDNKADRIGPDLPFTHWRLYYKKTMLRLCKKKFKKFSDGAELRAGAYAVGCSQIEIGKRVIIRPQSMLFGETSNKSDTSIIIEDDVMLGSGIHIYVNNHRFDQPDIPLIDQGHYPAEHVKIETGSWIGAGVIILPGVTIGRNSVIGAGSVVVKSIPSYSLAVGVPAKVVRAISEKL
jgi:acetyltransferase-like isoleucine patch superfamily enzyme